MRLGDSPGARGRRGLGTGLVLESCQGLPLTRHASEPLVLQGVNEWSVFA